MDKAEEEDAEEEDLLSGDPVGGTESDEERRGIGGSRSM